MTKSERRQRTALVAVRLLPAELEVLQQAAQRRDVSVSKLLRDAGLAEAQRSKPAMRVLSRTPMRVYRRNPDSTRGEEVLPDPAAPYVPVFLPRVTLARRVWRALNCVR